MLDHPNERSLHLRPVPRTGGLAIVGGIILGLCALLVSQLAAPGSIVDASREAAFVRAVWWVGGCLIAVALLSFLDDLFHLSAAARFVTQFVVAAVFIFVLNLRIETVYLPFGGSVWLKVMSAPLILLGIVWLINLYNFMDGMDGFAGGMAVIGFGFLGLLAGSQGEPLIASVSSLVVTATLGFLVFNFPPARIFMGDVGSTALGFLVGALSAYGIHRRTFDVWTPVLMFSPFVVDATATLLRRIAQGKKVWRPHREHYYQRLVLAGWTHRRTTLCEYALMVACGLSALRYARAAEGERLGWLLAWIAIYVALTRYVRRVESRAGVAQNKLARSPLR